MNNIFHKAKEQVKLSHEERVVVRASLARYAEGNPVFTRSPLSRVRTKKVLAGAVMASMLLGSSVSFAAEYTNPGDTLYPVKLYVNETARTQLTFGDDARAQWEARMAERRLEELENLELKQAPMEIRERAMQNFEAYASRVQGRMQRFEVEGKTKQADQLAERLVVRTRVHEARMEKHEEAIKNHANNLERVRKVRERMEQKSRDLKSHSR